MIYGPSVLFLPGLIIFLALMAVVVFLGRIDLSDEEKKR